MAVGDVEGVELELAFLSRVRLDGVLVAVTVDHTASDNETNV